MIAVFLVVAGLTGAILPFEQELTFLSRPDIAYTHPPHQAARLFDVESALDAGGAF